MRFAHIPANQLALNKLLINQAFENMGLRTTQLLGTLFDGVTRHTEEAYRWAESFREKGFREVIRERDAPLATTASASATGSSVSQAERAFAIICSPRARWKVMQVESAGISSSGTRTSSGVMPICSALGRRASRSKP